MFGFLKDRLKKSVKRLAERVSEAPVEEKEEKAPAAKPKAAKEPKPKPKKPEKKEAKKPKKPAKPETKKPEKPEKKEKPIEEKDAGEADVKPVDEPEPQPEPAPEPEPEPEPAPEPEPGPPQPELEREEPIEIAKEPEEKHEPKEAAPEEPARPEPEKEKRGFLGRLRGIKEAVVEKTLTDQDIDSFFSDSETDLLQANIALEAIDYMRDSMKKELTDMKIRRKGAEQFISKALEDSLLGLVEHGSVDLEKVIKKAKADNKPACMVFLGFNGAGKTTSIAKVAQYLMDRGHSVVLAAGDTFRAASIEQLEHHGNKLGIKTVKHRYGSDSAAVIFDARKHAESKGVEVVLADTAGRMHTDKNLADELKKVIRVNQPDLKILLVDSLTGNDAVEQAKQFHDMVGVDAVIMAKTDVNEKGGSILSVSYAIKKPILFLGTGQEYKDLKKFDPEKFVKELME